MAEYTHFSCPSCSKRFRVRAAEVGKKVRCNNCKSYFRVPGSHSPEFDESPTLSQSDLPETDYGVERSMLSLDSWSVGGIVLGLAGFWVLLVVSTLLAATVSKLQAAILMWVTSILTLIFAMAIVGLMRAKSRAFRRGEGNAWLGLLKIVAWDPNEGVLFLKDKTVAFVDSNPNDGGGVKLVLPWLGEELAFRAPLETRTTKFEDKDVLTREYVPLTIKGAIYWRLVDLERFYLSVSRSVHQVDDRGGRTVMPGIERSSGFHGQALRAGTSQQLDAGEEWLRLIAEEQTRKEVFQARTGLLVADKIVEGLPAEMQSLFDKDSYSKAADGLSKGIRRRIADIGIQHGIGVDRVSLQEVQLDQRIRERAVSACVSAYDPLIAQRGAVGKKFALEADAYGRKQMLEGEAQVIGNDAVAKREVLGSVKPYAFGSRYGGIVEVLEQFFENKSAVGDSGKSKGAPGLESPESHLARLNAKVAELEKRQREGNP